MDKMISVVIPVYNEEESLSLLYNRLKEVLDKLDLGYEILFVNDGSRDGSLDMIKNLKQFNSAVSYISLSRNFGKEIAMAAGLDYAVGDAVILMDADLQDPPELIEQMVTYWQQGYDDVYAKRISRDGESFLKKVSSHLFYRILKRMTKIQIHEDTGDFRLLSRRAVDALKRIREHHRYTKGYFDWIGFNKKEILFARAPRFAGKTKWNYFSLVNLAIEGITSFSISPLRLGFFFGGGAVLSALIYMVYKTVEMLGFSTLPDKYSVVIFLMLFLNGLVLISIGILGEYLGRIFNETKRRPLYFAEDYQGGEFDPQRLRRVSQQELINH